MPKTIFVTSEDREPKEILDKLIEKKIVQVTNCKGIFVFARHYLTKHQVRDAYKRTKK